MPEAVLGQVFAIAPGRHGNPEVDHPVSMTPYIAVQGPSQLHAGVGRHVLASERGQAQAQRSAVGPYVGREPACSARRYHAAPYLACDGVACPCVRQQAAGDGAPIRFELVAVAADIAGLGQSPYDIGHRKTHPGGSDVPLDVVANVAEPQVGPLPALASLGGKRRPGR